MVEYVDLLDESLLWVQSAIMSAAFNRYVCLPHTVFFHQLAHLHDKIMLPSIIDTFPAPALIRYDESRAYNLFSPSLLLASSASTYLSSSSRLYMSFCMYKRLRALSAPKRRNIAISGRVPTRHVGLG